MTERTILKEIIIRVPVQAIRQVGVETQVVHTETDDQVVKPIVPGQDVVVPGEKIDFTITETRIRIEKPKPLLDAPSEE